MLWLNALTSLFGLYLLYWGITEFVITTKKDIRYARESAFYFLITEVAKKVRAVLFPRIQPVQLPVSQDLVFEDVSDQNV